MNFCINEKTNHVIIEITEKELGKIIKTIRNSTGLSSKEAKRLWKRKMVNIARGEHLRDADVDFRVI